MSAAIIPLRSSHLCAIAMAAARDIDRGEDKRDLLDKVFRAIWELRR